jgi:hypothetical protein
LGDILDFEENCTMKDKNLAPRKKLLKAEVEKLGWKLTVYPDFRRQSVDLYTDETIIEATKQDYRVYVEAQGDVVVWSKRKVYEYKSGRNPIGKLTRHLRKHGEWFNNNWFEVMVVKDKEVQTEWMNRLIGEVAFNVDDAVELFLSVLREIEIAYFEVDKKTDFR